MASFKALATTRAAASRESAFNDKAVMPCPVCEGEGEIADGLDEAACSMPCPRCDGNAWLVDLAALAPEAPFAWFRTDVNGRPTIFAGTQTDADLWTEQGYVLTPVYRRG